LCCLQRALAVLCVCSPGVTDSMAGCLAPARLARLAASAAAAAGCTSYLRRVAPLGVRRFLLLRQRCAAGPVRAALVAWAQLLGAGRHRRLRSLRAAFGEWAELCSLQRQFWAKVRGGVGWGGVG
jgi:hypothetical protein